MTTDLLTTVQKLQFTDRGSAEALLRDFIRATFPRATFPALQVVGVQLRPQATSLNSFNGFLKLADGSRLFFKTHVEQDNALDEYYNARLLADAGYPVIQPLYSSTRAGQQILIYKVIDDPPVFDLARDLEAGRAASVDLAALTAAQNASDDQLLHLYLDTLQDQPADAAAQAPVHQLFYHRLIGGRLDRFYGAGTQISLPHGTFPVETVRQIRWTVNGAEYVDTLETIIERAARLLNPAQAEPSIIGHGDAHNGNVFYNAAAGLTYFDPAFAGRHHPLLDLTKPLFHNVFAMWMYFPDEEAAALSISCEVNRDHWRVDHNYTLNPVRQMFWQSKAERALIPILRHLKTQNMLRPDWRAYLKAALFCCPFLTLDLKRFSPPIALLGLAFAVQMGAEGTGSTIDTLLDALEDGL